MCFSKNSYEYLIRNTYNYDKYFTNIEFPSFFDECEFNSLIKLSYSNAVARLQQIENINETHAYQKLILLSESNPEYLEILCSSINYDLEYLQNYKNELLSKYSKNFDDICENFKDAKIIDFYFYKVNRDHIDVKQFNYLIENNAVDHKYVYFNFDESNNSYLPKCQSPF